ncbi:U3 small nucleolar RNA-associated protein 15 like protein [Nosema granulosis]|uniref:U3 small nucleolar RNA-associated protein 15 like protein n=1 Tax=Nosema granulosis TaxID=83296 RepID=A0A9P6KZN5_9MICR|nr:U3 small nucleolar RNA-associated protein 15 like protein [Nosema granulosis]
MFFKSSNYSVTDFSTSFFTTMSSNDSPIKFVVFSDNKIFFTQENLIYKYGKKNIKKVNKFDDKISAFREFDEILLAGDTRGNIKVIGNKNIVLRSYSEHHDKINDFALYKKSILLSCSNDGSIRVFDIRKDKSIKEISGFKDHVRCCKINGDILYCGTMNNQIYAIDLTTFEITNVYATECPVYKLDVVDEKTVIFSSFNKVYALNLQSKKPKDLISLTKEITHLSIQDSNICTTSLDGYLRSWSTTGLLISQINLYNPILSASISQNNLFFGLENGDLCKANIEEEAEQKTEEIINPRIKAFERQIDQEIIRNNIVDSNKVEALVRKYAHTEALRFCLEEYDIQNIFSILHYLQKENKLTNALTYIDKKYIYILLDFIIENFFVVDFFYLFYDCLMGITSIYHQDIYNEDNLMEKINILRDLVDQETYFQEKLIETVSLYECFEADKTI